MTKNPLTPAEVDALFAGRVLSRGTKGNSNPPKGPFVPRYDRCHGCREITPCLMTLSGEVTWPRDPEFELVLVAYVEHLRQVTGRRTILLCSTWCVGLREFVASTPTPETTARLFELER